MNQTKVISIMGPTASGKTELSIKLASRLDAEIISVDSALIYKSMNIGTAKPSMSERQGIPHWLIDICSPEQQYSVADFLSDAKKLIEDIRSKNKNVLLVGGTMLYFNALMKGLSNVPASDPEIRKQVKLEIEKQGLQFIHQKLSKVDPDIAKRVHENDLQRTSRAYEVFLATGKPLSFWQADKQKGIQSSVIQFALVPEDRQELHKKIEQRFELMLSLGLIDEVKFLIDNYELHSELPSMRSVGYRQVFQHLKGECDYNQMRINSIVATRQLAKRQLTWIRRWPDLNILNSGNAENLNRILEKTRLC